MSDLYTHRLRIRDYTSPPLFLSPFVVVILVSWLANLPQIVLRLERKQWRADKWRDVLCEHAFPSRVAVRSSRNAVSIGSRGGVLLFEHPDEVSVVVNAVFGKVAIKEESCSNDKEGAAVIHSLYHSYIRYIERERGMGKSTPESGAAITVALGTRAAM